MSRSTRGGLCDGIVGLSSGMLVDMGELRVRLPRELWMFVSPANRREQLVVSYDGRSSMGQVVESLGIPRTEVGHVDRDGDVLDVHPIERPQRMPPNARGFVLDVHLGTLARRLRLLGIDAVYRNDMDDDRLVERANAEARVLLTQDRRLLMRRVVWFGAYVRHDQPDVQLRDVLERFLPRLDPWTRCSACNGRLASVGKDEIVEHLQPGTRRSYDLFACCVECGHVYWRGAHSRRLDEIVNRARRTVRGAAPTGQCWY